MTKMRAWISSHYLVIGCGLVGCAPDPLPESNPPRFGFSEQFLGTIGGCQAVLFGEDQALFYSTCLGDSIWFKPDDELKSYRVLERTDTEAGLSVATLSAPVLPRYASLEIAHSGWNSRKVRVYDEGPASECEARKDGNHNCECREETHPALVYNGYVIGIVERCESLERSGIYVPVYMLNASN